MTPTQRTIKAMKNDGRLCGIVERFNVFVGPHGIRQDLFGFVDIIALDPSQGIVGVQCCAGGGVAAHRRKIVEECHEAARQWLRCRGLIEIWGWRKVKLRRGSAAVRWSPRIIKITLDDLDDAR